MTETKWNFIQKAVTRTKSKFAVKINTTGKLYFQNIIIISFMEIQIQLTFGFVLLLLGVK